MNVDIVENSVIEKRKINEKLNIQLKKIKRNIFK